MTLKARFSEIRDIINAEIDRLLPIPSGKEARVVEAMRYSAISSGKALRPFLALTVSEILGIPETTAIRISVAIELLHTYSLIHDDLPAMDNDTMRRGKPTNHIQFDEATAIIAGDALQTKAFEILSDPATHPDGTVRAKLCLELAKASGCNGMVGGQMLDLLGEKETLTLSEIEQMQALKTGALIHFSCIAPTLVSGSDGAIVQALTQYAHALGLMFQITDDILDVEGSSELMGKTLGKDAISHKSTFVSILGLDKAKELALNLKKQADDILSVFGNKATLLHDVLTFIIERKN